VTEKIKVRRVTPRTGALGSKTSRLVFILAVCIVALVIGIAVILIRSPLFTDPSAAEIARNEVLVALEASPDDPGLLMTLAEVEYALGREAEALEYAQKAADNAGETRQIFLRYGTLLVRAEELEKAIGALESELALDGGNNEARFLLAQVQMEVGRADEAIENLELALAAMPVDGDIRYVYARALAQANRKEDAIAAYQKVLEVLPNDERAIEGLTELGVEYEETDVVNPHGD